MRKTEHVAVMRVSYCEDYCDKQSNVINSKNQGSLSPGGKAEQLHIFERTGSKQCESAAPAHWKVILEISWSVITNELG